MCGLKCKEADQDLSELRQGIVAQWVGAGRQSGCKCEERSCRQCKVHSPLLVAILLARKVVWCF